MAKISKPGLYGAVGVTTVAVMVVGVIGYKAVTNKPKQATTTKPAVAATQKPAPSANTPAVQPVAPTYNGTYAANTNVAQGLASVTATVTNNSTITGTAQYNGPFSIQIPASITGTVNSNGEVSGSISGSGVVQATTIKVTGTFSGKILDKKVAVNYTVSAAGQSTSGAITLTKQ